jgi:Uma2 family endonuclease
MSTAAARMTVADFLAWAETQENGRHELFHGRIVSMAPERAEHAQAKLRAANALEAAIRRAGVSCEAFVDGLAVVIDETTSYVPDALVNCGAPVPPNSFIAPSAVIVIEVLSPSTRGLDKSAKLADYFRVEGLSHYVIVDLARRHVVHYRRQADGAMMVAIVKDAEIVLDPPGISVSAADLLPGTGLQD